MLVFTAAPVVATALVVWGVWRVVLWRRGEATDRLRELVVGASFLWSIIVVKLTFFPLYVIFYDWHGRVNLVPFASIMQLVRETPALVAFDNIVGNFVLLMPFGVLLPLLFRRLRTPGALALRVAAISLLIEATQFATRARSFDIDDIILNTSGAVVGLGFFLGVTKAVETRSSWTPRWRGVLDRLGPVDDLREPLRNGLFPVGVTAAIVVPMMAAMVLQATLGDAGVTKDVTDGWASGEVVARAELDADSFVLATDRGQPGQRLRLYTYNKVMPGRFSRETWGESDPTAGTIRRYSITPFNTDRGERPIVYAWGVAPLGARMVTLAGNGLDERVDLDSSGYFVAAFAFDSDPGGNLEDFVIRFLDQDGADVESAGD